MAPDTAIELDAREFAQAVAWVSKWVPARPANPIHAGIWIGAVGGVLRLEAIGDGQRAARTITFAEETSMFDDPWHAVVSARLLAALTKTLGPGNVQLRKGERATSIEMQQGRFQSVMPLMPESSWPEPPVCEPGQAGTAILGGAEFAAMVKRTAPSAMDAGDNLVLGCMRVAIGDRLELAAARAEQATMTAVDLRGSRRGTAEVAALAVSMAAAGAAFADQDEVTLATDGHLLELSSGRQSLIFSAIELPAGGWPIAHLHLHVQREYAHAVQVDVQQAVTVLRRVAVIADREKAPSALVAFGPGEIRIAADRKDDPARAGDVIEDVPGYEGEEIVFRINPEFLADALAGARTPTVRLRFDKPRLPILLDDEAGDWQHLIIGMRV